MQNIYTNSESLIELVQLAYLNLYSNVSTLKVMDGQRLRSDQPHTWRVTTDGPVGADVGKRRTAKGFPVFFVIRKRYKNTTLYSDVALSIINDFSESLTFYQFNNYYW